MLKSERREKRKNNRRKMVVHGKSIFLIQRLRSEPTKRNKK